MNATTPVTCNLAGGGSVIFDAADSTVWDYDDTWKLYDLFASTVGG